MFQLVAGPQYWYLNLYSRAAGLLLGFIFLYSSFSHLKNPFLFLSSIYGYQLVSAELGKILAAVLPFIQMVIGVSFLFNLFLAGSYFVSSLLFACYLVAQVSVLLRGIQTPCGCLGGGASELIGPVSLARVAVLFGIAVTGFIALAVFENRRKADALKEAIFT